MSQESKQKLTRACDITKLHVAIAAFFWRPLVEAEFLVPWSARGLRGEVFARRAVLDECAETDAAFFRVRTELSARKRPREQLGGKLGREE